jgi:hypothetical protein
MTKNITLEQANKHYTKVAMSGTLKCEMLVERNGNKEVYTFDSYEITYFFCNDKLVKIEVWDGINLVEMFVK